ncbi:monovalent cation/H+ antiporter subunit C [Kosmotoga arenicorallina S304]|uniref:Monovalent cation/H+ antiporter subunit C n=1 Tax=Kosmotoga arenicorallina S304 TaxID=1453497 RepID=A0A176K0W7_9BACT|nr:sodium:proton antiporter [Kosmotoga arenicorallina]OAA30676.1 monovalent cation/H+ antiporter subunit C [Kosmotoga arenicorallina S304]
MGLYLLSFILFLVGLYGVLTKANIVKIILGSGIMGYAVNLFLILIAYRSGGTFPILLPGKDPGMMVDPLPQALVLTSIVIELGTTALLVALAVNIYKHYGTLDVRKVRRLKG